VESDYCTLRNSMLTSCSIYTNCHQVASSDFEDTRSSVTAQQHRRNIECHAVHKIQCYINVILTEETITEAELSQCKNSEPDCSALDLTIPTMPALESCVLPSEADVPCSCGFMDKYTDMVRLDACVQCLPVPSSLASVDPGTLTGLPCGTPTPAPPPPPIVVLVPDSGTCSGTATTYADWGCVGKSDGHHTLQLPDGGDAIEVTCIDGWIMLQQRVSKTDFYKNWEEYASGFGDESNYWVGLRNWHRLTKNKAEFRIVLDDEGEVGFGEFGDFQIGSEAAKFVLWYGSYCSSSTIGETNSLDRNVLLNGRRFSTKDNDNDQYGHSCAEYYYSGWWFGPCHHEGNLNGEYAPYTQHKNANVWNQWKQLNGLDKSFMMLKPYA